MVSQPFIKKFTIDDEFYIYDVNRNAILQTDNQVYQMIDQSHDNCDTSAPYYAAIMNMKSQGYFSNQKPEITYFHSQDETAFMNDLRFTLEHELSRITLVVSEECNLRCKYCVYSGAYTNYRPHSAKKMSHHVMASAIDFYFSHSAKKSGKNISFFGGEPLLNFELIKDCVQYSEEKETNCIAYNMTTNGTLLTNAIMAFLAEHQFSLLISIDGPQATHDRNRIYAHGKGSFQQIYQNLKTFKKLFPDYYNQKIRFNMVITPPFDPQTYNEFIEDPNIKPAAVRFSNVNVTNSSYQENFTPDQWQEYWEQRSQFLNSFNIKLANAEMPSTMESAWFHKRYYTLHHRRMDPLPGKYPSHGQCILGSRALLVDVNGNFNFCTQVEDVFNLGNVFDGFNFPRIRQIYLQLEHLFKEQCHGCWAIRFCSKCIKEVNENGDISSLKLRSLCEGFQAGILQEMKDYIKIRRKNPNAFFYLDNIELV